MTELPTTVTSQINAAQSAGFRVERGHLQVMLWCVARDGRWDKVGGWNTKSKHWYVSKLLASGQDQLMERLGFRWMVKGGGAHCWWQIDGAESTGAFQAAVEALTGVTMHTNKPPWRIGRISPRNVVVAK